MRLIQFSIAMLLVLTAVVGGLLAWYVQPAQVTAVAQFLVSSRQATLLFDVDEQQHPTEQAIERFRATVMAQVLSQSVIEAALAQPGMANLVRLKQTDDPVDWIREKVEVSFVDESEILEVRMRGREEWSADMVLIVDAICVAFRDEVITSARLDRIRRRDALVANYGKLKEGIYERLDTVQRLKQELGEDAEDSPDLIVRRRELDRLMKTADQLAGQIEMWDIELQAAPRIQQIEAAYIKSE